MLPQAMPSTGRAAGAPWCRAASVVPSPPAATSRSQLEGSIAAASSRVWPATRTCPISTSCAAAQEAISSSTSSRLTGGVHHEAQPAQLRRVH